METYGDLKKTIKNIQLKQKGEKVGKITVDVILGTIPGLGAAKSTFDVISAAFRKPDTKKTNSWLDKLDVDDEMSAIVDDTVENGFLKMTAKVIDSESDDKPLEQDFNMNQKMIDYLDGKYKGRTITGITEQKSVFDKFFTKFAYKFDKGYPDMNNDQDVLLLESLISELGVNIGEVENLETINEDVKGKATLFESALIKAWYELKGKEVPEGNAPTKDLAALTTEMVEDAKNILKQTKLTGGNEAYQLGSASAGLTPFWKGHGATNTTPKTDIVIDGKKISLKVGPSQLMSGAGNELTATFYAALKNTPGVQKDIVDDIAKSIKDVFVRGTTKQGNVRQAKKAGDDTVLNKAVDEMGILKNKIADFLENNKSFQTAFAYEAATGAEKFGNNDGTANYILSISSNYKNGVLKPIDLDYASKIASKMKLDINMKSGSQKLKGIKTGKYNYYTVLRAGLADLFQDASDGISIDNEITL